MFARRATRRGEGITAVAIVGTTAATEGPPSEAGSSESTPKQASDRKIPYFPALDGLRGLAVAAVLLFHGGFSVMAGGYLGVSTFFTLSGFLITALLLRERATTSSIDLRRFWTRRFRRLMPAALAALALATLFGVFAADAVQRRNLAGDVTASLFDVANWRFIISGQAYADLFGAPSPVLHFWSLAIEEQFYLLYPVVAWVAFRVLRVSLRAFAGILVVLIGLSVALTLGAGFSPDRIYFGTDTRAAELLIGGLLATIVYDRRITRSLTHDRRVRPVVAAAGAVALATCVVLWATVPQDTAWLYHGGFPAYALLSSLVVLAAIMPYGPVRTLLAFDPLRQLGRISYGVYLYHWPVFLWLSPARTGWSDLALLGPRLAVTFALALLSFHFLETPIRRGAPLVGIRPIRFVPGVAATLVIATVLVTVSAPRPVIDLDQAAAELEMIAASPVGDPDGGIAAITPAMAPVPKVARPAGPIAGEPPEPRIAVFGDSTAMMTTIGLFRWAQASGEAQMVPGASWLGCGVGRGGERRSGNDYGVVPEHCNQWATTWAEKISSGAPNIAVVQIGPWEVTDRRLPGDDAWRSLGDPVYDAYLLAEMAEAVDVLSAGGAQVLWLSAPPVGAGTLGDAQEIRGAAARPERTARLNELIAQLPTERPGKVSMVDLAGWLASTDEDVRLRPDGVHFGPDQATEVAERFLSSALVETFRRDWVLAETQRIAELQAARRTILVLGDPTARGVADALSEWGADSGLLEVVTIGQPPCGVVPTATRRVGAVAAPTPDECEQVHFGWLQTAVAVEPDIVLVAPSTWDLVDLSIVGDDAVVAVGDPAFDDWARTELVALSMALSRTPATVVWLTAPASMDPITAGGGAGVPVEPERAAGYNRILAEVASEAPRTVVVDTTALLAQEPALALVSTTPGASFTVDDPVSFGSRLGPAVLAAGR